MNNTSQSSLTLKPLSNHATVFAVLLCATIGLGTGKPVSHEIRLATWRYAYDSPQNDSDMPRSERRQEINVRPESGGYPKGDAEVVEETFHHAPGHGVDKSRRQSERQIDFDHTPGHGVDENSTDVDRSSEHVSEHGRLRRTADGSAGARQLKVPLRKLIVGTEHVGRVFLIKKWHKYVKHLNFESVSHQLASLREQLARINPNEEGEFEKVFGKKDSYLLANTRASYAQNEIKCTEQDSVMLDLMQSQMEELAG